MSKFDFKIQLNSATSYIIVQIEGADALDALSAFKYAYPGHVDLSFINTESGGSISSSELELNVGDIPKSECICEIANSNITTDNTIIAEISNNVPTNKDSDELELEPITVEASIPENGLIRFTLNSVDSLGLQGYYKIQYVII